MVVQVVLFITVCCACFVFMCVFSLSFFLFFFFFFFFKQKTAYDMRISDLSSDVCSSDLFTTSPPGGLLRLSHVLHVHRFFSTRRRCGVVVPNGESIGWQYPTCDSVAPDRNLNFTKEMRSPPSGCQKIGRASCRERVRHDG